MRKTAAAIALALTACTPLPPLPPPVHVSPDSNRWGAKVADVVQIGTDMALFASRGEREARVKSLHTGREYYCSFEHEIQPGQYLIFWTNETYTHATKESAATCCRWLHNNWFSSWKSNYLSPHSFSCSTIANKLRISPKYMDPSIHQTRQSQCRRREAAWTQPWKTSFAPIIGK